VWQRQSDDRSRGTREGFGWARGAGRDPQDLDEQSAMFVESGARAGKPRTRTRNAAGLAAGFGRDEGSCECVVGDDGDGTRDPHYPLTVVYR
jgi:hypothetical protein